VTKKPNGRSDHRSGTRSLKPGKSHLPPPPTSRGGLALNRFSDDQLAFRQAKAKKPPPLIAGLIESIRPKLFVLDTNVLMHDPTALFRFDDNSVCIPMMTLEELDDHKKGLTEVARNARQASRYFDGLMAAFTGSIEDGIPLNLLEEIKASGRLFLQTEAADVSLPATLPKGKADNQILGVVKGLQEKFPDHKVVLVSKDINMRVKARVLMLHAEDYMSDMVREDRDVLYTGACELPAGFWKEHLPTAETWKEGGTPAPKKEDSAALPTKRERGTTHYRLSGPVVRSLAVNQFVYDEGSKPVLYARVQERGTKSTVLSELRDYVQARHSVWGITARNREQNFALNLLLDPDIDFVTITGVAGSGKTLLTLAAGLHQILDERRYAELIVTRVTVPVGDDIGFLPGNEEEKMGPWMGALDDNLEVLGGHSSAGEWGRAATNDVIRSKIKIKSLNFMRGRTFLNKFVLIDEAQNLTPKQMKTLITRAGPGTKMVCLGNLAQIDTPYLTEASSGLTYAVDRFRNWKHAGHIMLARGERSRLADYALEVL
jgi:PhoH-like ATPase